MHPTVVCGCRVFLASATPSTLPLGVHPKSVRLGLACMFGTGNCCRPLRRHVYLFETRIHSLPLDPQVILLRPTSTPWPLVTYIPGRIRSFFQTSQATRVTTKSRSDSTRTACRIGRGHPFFNCLQNTRVSLQLQPISSSPRQETRVCYSEILVQIPLYQNLSLYRLGSVRFSFWLVSLCLKVFEQERCLPKSRSTCWLACNRRFGCK